MKAVMCRQIESLRLVNDVVIGYISNKEDSINGA